MAKYKHPRSCNEAIERLNAFVAHRHPKIEFEAYLPSVRGIGIRFGHKLVLLPFASAKSYLRWIERNHAEGEGVLPTRARYIQHLVEQEAMSVRVDPLTLQAEDNRVTGKIPGIPAMCPEAAANHLVRTHQKILARRTKWFQELRRWT